MLITRKEAAQLLGISVATFDRWRKKLGIRGYTTPASNRVRFDSSEVAACQPRQS